MSVIRRRLIALVLRPVLAILGFTMLVPLGASVAFRDAGVYASPALCISRKLSQEPYRRLHMTIGKIQDVENTRKLEEP